MHCEALALMQLDRPADAGTAFFDLAERMLRAIAAAPADGWFPWHGDVTAATAALATELGLAVSCWTVDEEAEMQRLAALGVEAILTDRPDRLAKLFSS